jgi:hypothetical protein
MHFEFKKNDAWFEDYGNFPDKLRVWSVLCIIRDVLVIIAWIVFCTQTNWNVGSVFLFKIENLESSDGDSNRTQADEDYKHLFFGNPYLPHGVYQVVLKDLKDEGKKANEVNQG